MKLPGAWAFRPLGPADAPVLAALHAHGFDEPWPVETFAGLLALPGAFGHVASSRGAPAGFVLARVAADEAEILTLAVAQGSRRRGLGTQLVRHATEAAEAAGARQMFLEVAEDNEAGLSLYRALGFIAVGKRPAYYGKPGKRPKDALLMSCPLYPPPRPPPSGG
ncbi:MAG: GNAT family N-acetyltransferase [Rhodospirillales bacterium]